MFGEPIELRPGFSFEEMSAHDNGWENFLSGVASVTLPFRTKKVKGNRVRNRLADVGFSMDMRRTFSALHDVELTPEQKNQYITFFAHPPGVPSLEEAMDTMLFNSDARFSPDYEPPEDGFTDFTIREQLKGLRDRYRLNAERLMLREDRELFQKIRERHAKKAPTVRTQQTALESLQNLR
jgi:hypothetical protein